jgi:hypothetical protein
MAATPPTLAPNLSVAQPAMGGLITFSCVSNILASICNLGSCLGLPASAGVADGPRKNNNAITVKMAGKGDPRRKEVPSRLQYRGSSDQTFAHPGSEPASMRKFGEYAFLKDSRYARQAKS